MNAKIKIQNLRRCRTREQRPSTPKQDLQDDLERLSHLLNNGNKRHTWPAASGGLPVSSGWDRRFKRNSPCFGNDIAVFKTSIPTLFASSTSETFIHSVYSPVSSTHQSMNSMNPLRYSSGAYPLTGDVYSAKVSLTLTGEGLVLSSEE
jgi:hypothetical protein